MIVRRERTKIEMSHSDFFFFFQAEDGIRDLTVTGVQTCALPISSAGVRKPALQEAYTSCPAAPVHDSAARGLSRWNTLSPLCVRSSRSSYGRRTDRKSVV